MAAPPLAVDAASRWSACARWPKPPPAWLRPRHAVVVEAGSPDPRLRLAPASRCNPYLPPGLAVGPRPVGLRCVDGVARWAITVPVQVKVFGSALVAAAALPAGTALTQDLLAVAEIDIAAEPGAVYPTATPLARPGRPARAGCPGRAADRPGTPVVRRWRHGPAQPRGQRLQHRGREAQALSPGLEGQDTDPAGERASSRPARWARAPRRCSCERKSLSPGRGAHGRPGA